MEHQVGYNQVYKNKRIMKSHIAINSRDRNKKVNSYRKDYSDPNDFQITINKYKQFRNVISVRLIEAMIPNTQFIINENNKWIDIILPGKTTETNVELAIGNYTFSTLAAEIKTKLDTAATDAGVPVFASVDLNNTNTFKATITHLTGNFTLLFETGLNAQCSIAYVLGFEKEDVISTSNTVLSDYPYHINSTKYVDLKIDEIPDLGTTIDIKEDIQNQILKRIPLDVDFGKEQYYRANDSDRLYNYFTPIELSKLNIKLFSDNGKIYDSNRIDNYIILELIMLQDEAPDNVGFHPKQNDAIKDIKSKVDSLILNDADVMISNKTDNDFLDIYEDLTNQSTDIKSLDKKSLDNNLAENDLVDNNSLEVSDNESLNKNIIIDDDTQITDSVVNTNEIKNKIKNQTPIKELHQNEPKGASNDTTLLNNVSEFDNVHYDISNNEDKLNKFKTNELKNSEDELLNGLLKDKLIKIFEEHKLLIISIIIFLLIIVIVKRISQKTN